jgi:hypothetical protein
MKRQYDLFYIFGVFIIVQLVLWLQLGVVTSNEATKYIIQADALIKGNFPTADKYIFYLPIILLIALSQKLSLGYTFVVAIQCILSAIATFLFYKGTKLVFGRKVALCATLILCVFIPFYSWNFYLYSESIFFSFSLILYFFLCKFEQQRLVYFFCIWTMIIVLIFSRPFGILFIPPLFIYFLFANYKESKTKWLTLGVSFAFLISAFFLINSVFHGGEDMDAMKPFVEEHIICFLPQNPKGAQLDLKYYNNGLQDIFYYIIHNPLHFTKLMLQRLWSFFKFTRPWYSKFHNYALLVFIIPIYLLFLLGIKRAFSKISNLTIYCFALVVFYSSATTFQCDDWHSRFTYPIMPVIFVIASLGLNRLIEWKKN